MPLHVAPTDTTPESLTNASEQYLIFYSSIVGSQMWCPDCLNVEELVENTFSPEGAPTAQIVYVGDRPTSVNAYVENVLPLTVQAQTFRWKSPSNVFRGNPWTIQSVPTIVKIENGKEVKRLVDSEITPGLTNFIRS
ncbi:hypothetical protein GYMLUDRAFT_235060 [Collybiopsis luxurians FD-317 M1]|nr:hypothetical protein GYMLUDRAFT_235060 [Collybiopsis luxurians FD-317 M1]